jgi:uncharacterized protein (DUF1800 family)
MNPDRRQHLRHLSCLAVTPTWVFLAGCAGKPPTAAVGSNTGTNTAITATTAPSQGQYHLVNRLSWGANDAELARFARLGQANYVRQQLGASGPDALPGPVQARIQAMSISQHSLVDLLANLQAQKQRGEALPTEDERKAANKAHQEELNRLAQEAASRHLLRALYSPQQLRAQLCWFWFNHFNVHQHKHQIRAMLGDYEERAIRPHALGRFRDLLGAVLHHPAMLRYLDNDQNAANKLNENLGRELLELHTLGVNGGYTQQDVQEVARVLTGHGERLADGPPKLKPALAALYVQDGAYAFHPGRHDFGDKTVLGHRIAGRGAAELDEVLDLLAAHPSTARFISRKLAQFLYADHPPAELLDRMTRAYLASNGRIDATLEVLVNAPAFSQPEPRHFKDPMHFVISAVRAAYDERLVSSTRPMEQWLNRLGEGLANRQTPDGYPQQAEAWSSSGQMAQRFDIARLIGSGSNGLFKADEPAFPQLARPVYYQLLRPQMRADTRLALDNAASPQDWNTLYLSSPEFMFR